MLAFTHWWIHFVGSIVGFLVTWSGSDLSIVNLKPYFLNPCQLEYPWLKPSQTEVRFSQNHDLMRTVGFMTVLAAAPSLQFIICSWDHMHGDSLKLGPHWKNAQLFLPSCPLAQACRCGTPGLVDLSFLHHLVVLGYSWAPARLEDAGQTRKERKGIRRFYMQTCSFSECYICYLVNLRSIDVVHSQCSASKIVLIWDSSMLWRGAARYWSNNLFLQCLG